MWKGASMIHSSLERVESWHGWHFLFTMNRSLLWKISAQWVNLLFLMPCCTTLFSQIYIHLNPRKDRTKVPYKIEFFLTQTLKMRVTVIFLECKYKYGIQKDLKLLEPPKGYLCNHFSELWNSKSIYSSTIPLNTPAVCQDAHLEKLLWPSSIRHSSLCGDLCAKLPNYINFSTYSWSSAWTFIFISFSNSKAKVSCFDW